MPEGGAGERLVEELHRTVDTVGAALDQAVARIEPLRELSAGLLQRALELDRELEGLTVAAAEAANALRRSAASAATAPAAPPAASRSEPPLAPRPPSVLDQVEAVRDSIAESPTEFRPRRRFRPARAQPFDVPEGVRLVVTQMRVDGEPDSAIAGRLEEMGVEDPAAVLARTRNS
ncbi:MAG: hypothetical protein QOI10_2029 [Solirubrobacterales bacterium]|jgi:hypothetical protein|nr:hypothetical protein [Solirubrobacterales bacterium]